MSVAKVEVTFDAIGRGKLVVDGNDISAFVDSVAFERRPDGTTGLTVGFPAVVFTLSAECPSMVDDKTREALVALGWTPPGGG